MPTLKIKKLFPTAKIPQYMSTGAVGMDVFSNQEAAIYSGESKLISTGLAVEVPDGYELQVRPRSGLAATYEVTVLNSPGTIDSDYRGELKILLANFSPHTFVVEHGDRIAQLVIAPVVRADVLEVDTLSNTERGIKGFGSTGV
jgi:dUTP pyrophosphatase